MRSNARTWSQTQLCSLCKHNTFAQTVSLEFAFLYGQPVCPVRAIGHPKLQLLDKEWGMSTIAGVLTRNTSWPMLWNALLAALAVYIFVIEPSCLVVRRVEIPIPDLPRALDGFKIGQLSDMHRGPMMPRSHIERAVALMVAETPDLVALTGDFVSYWPDYAAEYRQVLAPLHPPSGMFACTGNHEHWTDPDAVATALRAAGVTVLRNQHQLVTVGGAQLCIVGIDYVGFFGFSFHHADSAGDLSAALVDSPISDATRVLLVHSPDFVMDSVFAEETARRPIHLVLSGHTHGGQIRLPLVGAPYLPSRYRRLFGGGLVQAAGTQVYVSRGVGSSWPMRFNCPPEVNVLTLRRA
jgi:predicted MPP superfamily phosphohydrolase